MKRIALLLVFLLTLTACGNPAAFTATNVMADVHGQDIAPIDIPPGGSADLTKEIAAFSLHMFKNLYEDQNTLISPLSILSALAMTANGAEQETLSQMEAAFGADIHDWNDYLYAYRSSLPTADKYKVSLANSIWFKDTESLTVEEEFLRRNKTYYEAEVYKAPFDTSTKDDINAWVNEKTEGQIQKLLEQAPPPYAVMYLINALSFDAEWQQIYRDISVREGTFTTQGGDIKPVDFMHSDEHGYLELPNAVGFSKPYADDQYSFVALLPDEGLALSDFIASLDGSMLMEAMKHQKDDLVYASIPKFSFDYSAELADVLKALGIRDAFDVDAAAFSSLGQSAEGNIFISRVIHKTKIAVDEKGTKAGAVTAVIMETGSAPPSEPKTVNLNRPFFFMIVDNQFHMPIFMGVVNDPAV